MAGRLVPTIQRAFTAAVSARLKPLSRLCVASNSTGLSLRSRCSDEQRLAPTGWARLPRLGLGFRTYYSEGGWSQGGSPNSPSAQVYEQYGQPLERAAQTRPPMLRWEKDLANAVQLIGNVGRDIEMKYLDNGKVVATTTLAVRKFRRGAEEASWFDLEMWDDVAEVFSHHVSKGEQIFVTGRIEVNTWVKDDVPHTRAKIVVNDMCFVEPYAPSNDAGMVPNVRDQEEASTMGSPQRNWSQQQESPNMGSSQRNWNQQKQSTGSQPPQGAGNRSSSNNFDEAALATEKKWQEYFADPTQWWDNRLKKRNPKGPDFKHKSTQEVLWITSWSNPPWVAQQLAVLEEKKAQHTRDFGGSAGQSQKKKLSSFQDSDFLH